MTQKPKTRTFADIVAEVDAQLSRAAWAKDNSPPIARAGNDIEPEVDYSEDIEDE